MDKTDLHRDRRVGSELYLMLAQNTRLSCTSHSDVVHNDSSLLQHKPKLSLVSAQLKHKNYTTG